MSKETAKKVYELKKRAEQIRKEYGFAKMRLNNEAQIEELTRRSVEIEKAIARAESGDLYPKTKREPWVDGVTRCPGTCPGCNIDCNF